MSILLDTNACVAAVNRRPLAVRERLDDVTARGTVVAISSVVIFELRYGIAKSKRVADNTGRVDLFLASLQILPFDQDDARIAGNIRVELERLGTPIGPYDYLIAAQALRHGFLLVTANTREFSRVAGLRWEDWSKPF